MKRVLVVIVTFNAVKWLEKCLGSVASQDGADAIIIDNASTDGTPDRIAERWPQFVLIRSGQNLGFGAANNLGMKYALEHDYDYVYLLNQDAWLLPGTLDALLAAFENGAKASGYAVLSPVQTDAQGLPDANFARKCSKYLPEGSGSSGICEVPFVMAAHWLVSAECLRRVGGFSPAFKQYGEDDNYLDRVHFHGLRCGVLPSVSAVHDRASRRPTKEARLRLKTVSSVVRVSNPARNFALSFLLEHFILAGMAVKNLSLAPLRFIPCLWSRKRELSQFRDSSRSIGAFL